MPSLPQRENTGADAKEAGGPADYLRRASERLRELAGAATEGSRLALFWAKVDDAGGCWLWKAGKSTAGYGRFWDGARYVQAHRFAYEVAVGPIAAGLQIDHLCRVPACVNPGHLEAVTNRENTLRGAGGVLHTECPQGHEFTPETTRWLKTGTRRCRVCDVTNKRAQYRPLLTDRWMGKCSSCRETFVLTKDGRVWAHRTGLGPCPGNWKQRTA